MFEQRFDDLDASVIARQLACMGGKPGTGFDNGHLFESGIHRENRRHAAPHFQNASCLPGAQGGQYHPLAQFCLGRLEGCCQIRRLVAFHVAVCGGRDEGGRFHAGCHVLRAGSHGAVQERQAGGPPYRWRPFAVRTAAG